MLTYLRGWRRGGLNQESALQRGGAACSLINPAARKESEKVTWKNDRGITHDNPAKVLKQSEKIITSFGTTINSLQRRSCHSIRHLSKPTMQAHVLVI